MRKRKKWLWTYFGLFALNQMGNSKKLIEFNVDVIICERELKPQ